LNYIPANYYCHFELELDRSRMYTIEIDRFRSKGVDATFMDENVEFQMVGGENGAQNRFLVTNADMRKTLFKEQN